MMPQAWPLFFTRRKLRPIQENSIPHIIRGESVLLSGPTASGKTEAAVAPLFQRHVSFNRQGASVVYVAPTKALVNDLYYRLDSYFCAQFPGMVRRYTGDRHEFNDPEDVFLVFATPEALDSLQLIKPESLAGIRAIVIDEIHLLHGNARGQQLRHVISRIQKYSSRPTNPKDVFQKIGMTATLQDMEGVSRLWLGDNSITVQAGDARNIDIKYIPVKVTGKTERPVGAASVISDWLRQSGISKVLIFGNTRNNTQALAAKLHELLHGERWPVHWHTGVLAATERERIEEDMKNDRFGVCVATSTLEVGIDIGDIDVIVLADPPFSINAFLQRIGRGNRKTETNKVVAIYSDSQELLLYRALHKCACSGILDDAHEYDRPSVRFQQILSFAWRGVSRDRKPLTLQNIEERTGEKSHEYVAQDMLMTGALENDRGALIPSTELMDQGENRKIHTTITGSANLTMVDGASGETLIAISAKGISPGALYVGGKIKQVVSNVDGSVSLEKSKSGEPLTTLPATRGKKGLSRNIIWAIAELEGYEPHKWIFQGDRLTTWGGADYNQLLALILELTINHKSIKADEYGITGITQGFPISPQQLIPYTKEVVQAQNIPLEEARKFCDKSRFFKYLSREMKAAEAFRSIPFDGFLSWLQECNSLAGQDVYKDMVEENIDKTSTPDNFPENSKMITLKITWKGESKDTALFYARALTSHLFAAAGSVKGKTSETPLIQDLDLEDCEVLLKDKSEPALTFAEANKGDGLSENWTFKITGEKRNQIELTVSNVKPSIIAHQFIKSESLHWLQFQEEMHSPVGALGLMRNDQQLHLLAFHTLVGLASFCGAELTAELKIEGNEGPLLSWQSFAPSDEDTAMPINSYFGGSLWLPEYSESSQGAPALWCTLHDEEGKEKETPWIHKNFWLEKISDVTCREAIDLQQISVLLTEFMPVNFYVEVVSFEDAGATALMSPPQEGTVMVLSPKEEKVSIGLDITQSPETIEKAILHAVGHLLCGHVVPGDEYGHADTTDTLIGQGHLNRWDQEANHLLQSPKKSSLNDCTPKEKAMLGIWQMIGEMIGRNQILHRKAERYQKAAYQRQGAQRLLAQLEEYGGAMLCDGVGLGKTYVTTTLLVHYANTWLEDNQGSPPEPQDDPFRITILAPNSVVSTWQREALPPLSAHGVPLSSIRVVSHTKLSRITAASEVLSPKSEGQLSDLEHLIMSDLVVVDEAHNFRSVSARRTLVLRDLLRLQPRKDQRRLVLLLTATPVNNSLEDLQQESALLFSRPLWLSDAQTVDGYRRQAFKEVSERCKKARSAKAGSGDIAALIVHGRSDARFSIANDFRDDLNFGSNVQRIGDYLKEQDKKLKKYQEEIKAAATLGNNAELGGKTVRIAEDLLDRIVVQRSRALCKEIEMQQGSDVKLLFRHDAEQAEKLYYSDEYDGIKDVLANFLPLFETNDGRVHVNGLRPLSLKVYMWYDVREGIKAAEETSSVVGLQRILVLKRLESSPVSFLITLLRLMVLHAHRLHQLLRLCLKVNDIKRQIQLKTAINKLLDRKKHVLNKIGSLATGYNEKIDKDNFIELLSKAYLSARPAADADDHKPIQLSLFNIPDGNEEVSELAQLDRLWDLGSTLLEDFETLLQATPELTDIVFGKFSRSQWPHRFTAGGENVDWPESVDWGLRIVTDPKIRRLVARVVSARRQGQKVIVFSQFSDTLAYIHSVLKACNQFTRKEWSLTVASLGIEHVTDQEIKNILSGVKVITGDTEDRDTVISSFAPFYRIGPTPPPGYEASILTDDPGSADWVDAWTKAICEPVDTLFSTDVLAEGVNLQDVSVLVNFDVHWNPVRMIQRSGRIDRRLNPAIEEAKSFPEVEKIAERLGKTAPTYYWKDKQDEAPVTINMILPDEIEKELLLRERIAVKTLAIDFTLGLDQGTGAEAKWMENYKYQGISSLNAFQQDRAIEKVASYYDKLNVLFREQGIATDWTEKLNGWFREGDASFQSPIIGRVKIGKRGGEMKVYSRYIEPQMKDDIPHWLWSQSKPGQASLNFWIGLDAKTFPPNVRKDLDWQENASLPVGAEHLLYTVASLIDGNLHIKELPPQEVGKPLMQGVTAMAAGFLGSDEDRRLIKIGEFFLLQLHNFFPNKKTD
jgi:ATP-dependent Lhr-like helicase